MAPAIALTINGLPERRAMAGVQHLFDAGDVGHARSRAGEAHGGRLQRNPELGQRLQLSEVDRRDNPVATVAADQLFAFEPDQRGADRRPRSLEAALEPAFGQPLAGAKVEGEDHLAELVVDLKHLRHGLVPRRVHGIGFLAICVSQFGIPNKDDSGYQELLRGGACREPSRGRRPAGA
jgi:hypothetical protein